MVFIVDICNLGLVAMLEISAILKGQIFCRYVIVIRNAWHERRAGDCRTDRGIGVNLQLAESNTEKEKVLMNVKKRYSSLASGLPSGLL